MIERYLLTPNVHLLKAGARLLSQFGVKEIVIDRKTWETIYLEHFGDYNVSVPSGTMTIYGIKLTYQEDEELTNDC